MDHQETELQTISQSFAFVSIDRSLSRTPSLHCHSSNNDTSTNSTSVLGDVRFAPPPPFPTSLQVTKAKILGQRTSAKSTLPSFSEVKHSGQLLARFSTKSRLTKKWRHTYWIVHGNHRILFFRSKDDFDEWAANPYLTTHERNNKVKLAIDFKNDGYKPGFTMDGYKISTIKSKYIKEGKSKRMASNFKLCKWQKKGSSIVVAFGGRDASSVGALHKIMSELAKNSGNKIAGDAVENECERGDDAWDTASIGFSFSNVTTGSVQSSLSFSGRSFDERDDISSCSRSRRRHSVSSSSLGSKIATRMRSRSPTTHRRRLKEIDAEQTSDSIYLQLNEPENVREPPLPRREPSVRGALPPRSPSVNSSFSKRS